MAEIEDTLITYLLTQTGLTDLIDRRISFDDGQQETKVPYVVGNNISAVPLHSHQGQLSLASPAIQFTVYAKTRSSMQAVANQIKLALKDYQDDMDGTEIQYIKLINEFKSTFENVETTVKFKTNDLEFEVNYIKE